MNQQARIDYFKKLRKEKPYTEMDIYYKGERKKLPVYQIDLDFLIYNKWNGRIASWVKSYNKETGKEIDPTNKGDVKLLEEFLQISNESANKATEKSIFEIGQDKYGIVTSDGVVIDGNRRSMILRRVAKKKNESPAYFKAIVLDELLDKNEKEIMRLETTYQMGEDAKVDYDPIQKYLKCKDMKAQSFTEKEIGKAMGEVNEKGEINAKKITEYLEIMDLMDQYLKENNYSGIYTRLAKTEDLFINLNKVLKSWSTKGKGKVKWNPTESDLTDFKLICFDWIRYVYNSPKGIDAKDIRSKLIRNSDDSFFVHENIWKSFIEKHEEKVESITNEEKSVDDYRKENPTRNLTSLLKSRDEAWAKQVDSGMKENYGKANSALENLHNKNKPLTLLNQIIDKIEAIDTESTAFLEDPNVFEAVSSVNSSTYEFKKIIKNHSKTI
jgi:hypothetical protein